MERLTWILPQNPDNALEMPWAINSRSTSTSSTPVEKPRAGTLMGTCRTPKKVRANIAGIVPASAFQLTALKSVPCVSFPIFCTGKTS